MLALFLDKKIEYAIYDGGAVVWSSYSNLAFLVNFSSILISNIMSTLTFLYRGQTFTFLITPGAKPSSFSNYIRTFAVSFTISLVQKPVPDFVLISY